MRQEFSFKYNFMKVSITLDELNLTIKMGFRTWTIETVKLRYLYVNEYAGVGKEFIIAYEDKLGKIKSLRANADFGELGFNNFIDELVKQHPNIDKRHLPAKEAMKLMHAVNTVTLTLVLIFIFEILFLSFIFFPSLVRGIITTTQTIAATQLSQKELIKTSRLSITNPFLLYDYSIKETTTDEDSDETTITYFIPIVSKDWTEGDPVHMVLQTEDLSDDEFNKLADQTTVSGILRNILWEGLSNDNKEYFANKIHISLAPDAMLLEYRADPQSEFITALIVIIAAAVFSLIGLFIIGRVMLKQQKT